MSSPRYNHTPDLEHGYIDGLANREVLAPWHVANYVDTNSSEVRKQATPQRSANLASRYFDYNLPFISIGSAVRLA